MDPADTRDSCAGWGIDATPAETLQDTAHHSSTSARQAACDFLKFIYLLKCKKGSSYSITKHRVPELIPVLGSRPAGDVSHKPSGRLPLISARPAVTPATLKRAATNFAAW